LLSMKSSKIIVACSLGQSRKKNLAELSAFLHTTQVEVVGLALV
jgi:hypothetical protein